MTAPKIIRKKKVGLNIIELEVDEPKVFLIKGLGSKFSKKFKNDIPYFEVVDINSGEQGMIWIDGGIKGAFGGADQLEKCIGNAYEFTHRGLRDLGDDTGREVNVYDIFEVDVES